MRRPAAEDDEIGGKLVRVRQRSAGDGVGQAGRHEPTGGFQQAPALQGAEADRVVTRTLPSRGVQYVPLTAKVHDRPTVSLRVIAVGPVTNLCMLI